MPTKGRYPILKPRPLKGANGWYVQIDWPMVGSNRWVCFAPNPQRTNG